MSRDKKQWDSNFIEYMNMIIHHPNYKGLPIKKKKDGSYCWVATAKTKIGNGRIEWCKKKARELKIPEGPGMYADVMLEIHPTKEKVCQICGKSLSLYYLYPNKKFLDKLNDRYETDYTDCDNIKDIWDDLIDAGFRQDEIASFFIKEAGLNMPNDSEKDKIISAMEYACRKQGRKCLGPGAMSDFPDRFDGFHTYNRCCRSTQDSGRSRENLKTYEKDRRAYEYWSDGNIHAANLFMHSEYFEGLSGDHIGPISLGFIHDPHYIVPMENDENSEKRDRLDKKTIDKIVEVETRTGICPMSWYSKKIWECIKANYEQEERKIANEYRNTLKQNMSDFMYAVSYILENCGEEGESFLKESYLEPNFECFKYKYKFDIDGNIIEKEPRHNTERNADEMERYVRIALNSARNYQEKENRHIKPYLNDSETRKLKQLCESISVSDQKIKNKQDFDALMEMIETRLIKDMS